MVDANNTSPFNAVPRVVVLLCLVIAAGELVFWAGSAGLIGGMGYGSNALRLEAVAQFSYFPDATRWMLQVGELRLDYLWRFVTYPFVHTSFVEAVFVIVFTLALGKMTAESFPGWVVLAVFFGAAIAGALVYTLLVSDNTPLIGGFPAAYGLIGSYTFLMWVGYGAMGANRLNAFRLIGFLLGIQLLFGVLFRSNNTWIAELAGFGAGFVIAALAVPGAIGRIAARLRQR